ncbi:NineTeen Complex (NTC) component [Scheffersomyces spartinae]|uniref:Pre-mRNA-splicing factor ISY1 n=1 Tax=Scheffersomyces spartinae TaxID=45513 RepID=A0A9P7VBH6_9ASCO|nr:NineTeen Complex (NTC) component [Scheffersomyces spartinae]KAG7194481.1 NineTeen Complex (NTC) component [Scheffersomyces spartinae]
MSRNLEKSQSELHRFQHQKNLEAGVLESNPKLRPKNVKSVSNLAQAERWRTVIMGEISQRLTRIQDPTASDETLRELNNELAQFFKEKRSWEYHIKELGGIDHLAQRDSIKGQMANGIRYYGRARELPEVQQLLKAQKEERDLQLKQQQGKLKRAMQINERRLKITEDYYGLNEPSANEEMVEDEDDQGRTLNQKYKLHALKQSRRIGLIGYERRRTKRLMGERNI